MDFILNHNLDTALLDTDFASLYESRKREANFAAVFRDGDSTYALRDHIGSIPLFYRKSPGKLRFSTNLTDLVLPGDTLAELGLRCYLGFGTCTISPLFREISIVPPGAVLRFRPGESSPDTVYQYRFRPRHIPFTRSRSSLLYELRELLLVAIGRCVRSDDIGLTLSGGIDSFLVGALLKEAGHPFRSYATARWGEISSEFETVTACARVLGTDLQIDSLHSSDYRALFCNTQDHYPFPCGDTSILAVVSLLQETDIARHSQVFSGLSADVLNASTLNLNLAHFSQYMPSFFRAYHGLPYADPLKNLAHLTSQGTVTDFRPLFQAVDGYQGLVRQILGALLFTNVTYVEFLMQPLRQAGVDVTHPFLDMDVLEFMLGIPLRHRIRWRLSSMPITMDKTLFRLLAREYGYPLPLKMKKGYSIPMDNDKAARDFSARLPRRWDGIPLTNYHQRFAALCLREWGQQQGILALSLPPARQAS